MSNPRVLPASGSVLSWVMLVVLGMSGGVDSSLSAWLLKEAGHKVLGVSLVLFESSGAPSPTSCCSFTAVKEAARTAAAVGIEHTVVDARDQFIDRVITPFAAAYSKGLTPNPCVLCNRHVKFPILLEEATKKGGGLISTGHYSKVEKAGGRAVLKAGDDPRKDQSYFLYALRRRELDALTLPLGRWTKERVREKARELALPVFSKPESQEICFVGQEGYAPMVSALEPEAERPGVILNHEGKEIGRHRGIIHYTMGQRKGLGISNPEPLYVLKVDAASNTVIVGPRELAYKKEIIVININWLEAKERPFEASVKIRSTAPGIPALVKIDKPEGNKATVEFKEPAFAPAPGQSAVFYEGDTVTGGGVIAPETDQ